MIARVLVLAGGLAGAGTSAQFPEFSQQYVQRLGGAVDALSEVVADFDASAKAEGLTRDAALAQMTGSSFIERRRADMETTFQRHAYLSAQLDTLGQAGPFTRAYHAAAMDGDVARAAWQSFAPALPLTLAGALFAAMGFVFGALCTTGLIGTCRAIFRARKPASA